MKSSMAKLETLVLRQNNLCGICGLKMLRIGRFETDPLLPNIDHVIPVSQNPTEKGSLKNLQATHIGCNLVKNNFRYVPPEVIVDLIYLVKNNAETPQFQELQKKFKKAYAGCESKIYFEIPRPFIAPMEINDKSVNKDHFPKPKDSIKTMKSDGMPVEMPIIKTVFPENETSKSPIRTIIDSNQILVDVEAFEQVNHPNHYNNHPSGVECIDVVEHFSFNIGNAIKYLWRCNYKGKKREDLEKAKWYIDRELEKLSE